MFYFCIISNFKNKNQKVNPKNKQIINLQNWPSKFLAISLSMIFFFFFPNSKIMQIIDGYHKIGFCFSNMNNTGHGHRIWDVQCEGKRNITWTLQIRDNRGLTTKKLAE